MGQKPKHQGTNSTTPVYNLGGPCVRGVKGERVGGRARPPSPALLATSCATQLETLNEVVLKQFDEGTPNGLAVEYRQLPEVT